VPAAALIERDARTRRRERVPLNSSCININASIPEIGSSILDRPTREL